MFRIGILCTLLAIALFPPWKFTLGEELDGWQALQRGDYDLAEQVWLPRAERGEVEALLFLGHLETMREQYSEAAKWYQRAAAKGNATAQTPRCRLYAHLALAILSEGGVVFIFQHCRKIFADGS